MSCAGRLQYLRIIHKSREGLSRFNDNSLTEHIYCISPPLPTINVSLIVTPKFYNLTELHNIFKYEEICSELT